MYLLTHLTTVLGLEFDETGDTSAIGISDEEIETLIAQRAEARATKNYQEGDRIRDLLKEKGITIIDSKGQTKWHRE